MKTQTHQLTTPPSTQRPHAKRVKKLGILGIGVVIVSVLLILDLTQQGLAWRFFWSVTGEETPLAQMRGVVEWLGHFIRTQPTTEPYVSITHTDVNPYGINTFLEQEVEPEKRERQVQMIADAGFGWMRQQFPWADIEIEGQGDFVDRRNDVDQDGIIDEISAWEKYDQIVALAEQYGLQIQVRLDNPPAWSRSNPDAGSFAPPDDFQDFVNYAVAVAERYQGRLYYYQVWNEPNIYPEWGEQSVSPEAYTELLCRTYDALKAVDPNIVVITGALAPTISLTGRDLNDFIFLERMYAAGASRCFDVLSVQGYGLNSGPTDRRMRPTTVNFSRNLYIRDLMVANGDEHKSIWISEAAWNPIDAPEVPSDVQNRENYGVVTPEQASRYMPLAYQRAQEEWPWIGVMHYWFFKRAGDSEQNQSWYYFRMVEPDFTPLPIYDTLREYITSSTPTLYRGVHQETDWAVNYPDDAEIILTDDALTGTAVTTQVQFTAQGTGLQIRWLGESPLQVVINGEESRAVTGSQDWQTSTLNQSILAETMQVEITSDSPFTLDSITVYDTTTQWYELVGMVALAGVIVVSLGLLWWVTRR